MMTKNEYNETRIMQKQKIFIIDDNPIENNLMYKFVNPINNGIDLISNDFQFVIFIVDTSG
jgi:hypothetical protein